VSFIWVVCYRVHSLFWVSFAFSCFFDPQCRTACARREPLLHKALRRAPRCKEQALGNRVESRFRSGTLCQAVCVLGHVLSSCLCWSSDAPRDDVAKLAAALRPLLRRRPNPIAGPCQSRTRRCWSRGPKYWHNTWRVSFIGPNKTIKKTIHPQQKNSNKTPTRANKTIIKLGLVIQ